jgi:hypothetical protein
MAERESLPQSITDIKEELQREAEATGIAESLLIEGIEVDVEVVKQRAKPTGEELPQKTQSDEGFIPTSRTES